MKILLSLVKIFPAEISHYIALGGLKLFYKIGLIGLLATESKKSDQKIQFGCKFKNSLGIAAGLDKNGDYFDALGALGFGFIEIGTITPLPQPGNPKPRIFRLFSEEAIINKLGFNNKGVDYLVKRLKKRRYKGVLGVNIGANKKSNQSKRIDDYIECYKKVCELSDYVTINISSPNTPNLRDLHSEKNINNLLSALLKAKNEININKPIFIKISPDEKHNVIEMIVSKVKEFNISGLIVSNTTIDKSLLKDKSYSSLEGGLSGKPIFTKSTQLIKDIKQIDPDIKIIGVGGVISKDDFKNKIDAGADLVQIYTGFILKGPDIISELLD